MVDFRGYHNSLERPTLEPFSESLHEHLKKKPPELSDIRGFMRQMAIYVDVLKSIDMIHGNINSMNLCRTHDMIGPDMFKMTDLSSSMHTSQAERRRSELKPFYRAPEIDSGQPLSEAMDMWSLGCILTLMMSRCSTFGSDNGMRLEPAVILPLGFLTLDELRTDCLDRADKAEAEETAQCVELAMAMLQSDPTRRIMAQELRDHPFIRKKRNRFRRFVSRIKKRFFPSDVSKPVTDAQRDPGNTNSHPDHSSLPPYHQG